MNMNKRNGLYMIAAAILGIVVFSRGEAARLTYSIGASARTIADKPYTLTVYLPLYFMN